MYKHTTFHYIRNKYYCIKIEPKCFLYVNTYLQETSVI